MTARPSNPAMMRSVVDMRQTVRHRTNGRNLNGHGSLDVRLSDRWACQPTTARARRERSLEDVLATMEEARAMGRTALLEHYVNLFDAVLAGLPGLPRVDAIYQGLPGRRGGRCGGSGVPADPLQTDGAALARRDGARGTRRHRGDGRPPRRMEPLMPVAGDPSYQELEAELARRRNEIARLGAIIADELFASTFQTIGGYRAALLRLLAAKNDGGEA
jgi:hypothetical protein